MTQFKLVFYVPEFHCEAVKAAVFAAGAGRQGNYAECAWQVLGQGQFKPMEASQPFVGEQGKLETVAEYRVEVLCEEHDLDQVISALKKSHPYEEPAFDVIALASLPWSLP